MTTSQYKGISSIDELSAQRIAENVKRKVALDEKHNVVPVK